MGGAIFEITPPPPGSMARENFDAQIATGLLVPIETERPARKRIKPSSEPSETTG